MLLKPKIFELFPQVAAAQSTRHGGVSPAPWNTLNLGKSTDDDPANLPENRRRFCAALGFDAAQLAWSRQVHGTEIKIVERPGGQEGFDALVTDVPGILLSVSVADCAPILVFDEKHMAVAAIHAGWRGAAAGIVAKTLGTMAERYGSRGANCHAYIGACIAECSFEVGDEVAEAFAEPFKRFDNERNKYFVDLKKACAAQCLAFGIPSEQMEVSPFCTVLDNRDFFSHRADGGITGRGLGAIGISL